MAKEMSLMLDSRGENQSRQGWKSHDKNQDMDSLCGSMFVGRAISSSFRY